MSPQGIKELRLNIADFAPRGHFHICYYYSNRRAWYRIYDPEMGTPLVCKSPFLTKTQAETVWAKVKAMWTLETRVQNEPKSSPATVIDFPKPVS